MYLSILFGGKKSNAIKKLLNPFRGRGCYIKQAIQGLFTAGTSEKKEKVGGKRGLTHAKGVNVPIILQAQIEQK